LCRNFVGLRQKHLNHIHATEKHRFLWPVPWRSFPLCACTCCSVSLPSYLSPSLLLSLYIPCLAHCHWFFFILHLNVSILLSVHLLLSLTLCATPWTFFLVLHLFAGLLIPFFLSPTPCASHSLCLSLSLSLSIFSSIALSCFLSHCFSLYPFVSLPAHTAIPLCPLDHPRFFFLHLYPDLSFCALLFLSLFLCPCCFLLHRCPCFLILPSALWRVAMWFVLCCFPHPCHFPPLFAVPAPCPCFIPPSLPCSL